MRKLPAFRHSSLLSLLVLALCGACAAAGESAAQKQPAPADLLPNGMLPFEGVLTGGQPSAAQLEKAKEAGYATVINMRMPDEPGTTDPEAVRALGMDYVDLPIEHAEGVSEANARKLAEILDKARKPVIVHCGSGNRVGALFALKARFVDGKTPDEALEIGKSAGLTRLEPVVREKLGLPAEP